MSFIAIAVIFIAVAYPHHFVSVSSARTWWLNGKGDSASPTYYSEAKRVTLVGAALDFALGVLKIAVGISGHSQALIADGVHSFSDLLTDLLVVLAVKYGVKDADEDHPYGHDRIQTIATVALGVALVVVAVGIARNATQPLVTGAQYPIPNLYTLAVALVAIGSKEWIFRYTMRAARKFKSPILEANAWHSRSDALSSIVVLIGIVGSIAGATYLDTIAAIVVAVLIVQVGGKMALNGAKELIDTGVAPSIIADLESTMASVEGVVGVHQLRTRKAGQKTIADVHITVNSGLSVSEGHRIAEEVESAAIAMCDSPLDLTVHIDAGKGHGVESTSVPLREHLEDLVSRRWAEISELPLEKIGIHYRHRHADIDLYVSAELVPDMEVLPRLRDEMVSGLATIEFLGEIKILMVVK